MKRILLMTVAVMITLLVVPQETFNLRMNLQNNKVYRLKSVSEQTITQTINGNQQTVESDVNYVISVKRLDITPDFMVTEIRFDTLITNTNSMGKMVSMNSTSDGDLKSSETGDIMSCIMNRLSRNAVYVKMDFAGKPVEIVNAKMLSDIVLKDTASLTLTEPLRAALKKQMEGTVSESTLRTMIGGFTWHLPAKQVAVGDEWVINELANSGGMLLAITTTYHLDAINGDNASITAESNIRAAENATPIQSGGATVTYDNLTGMNKSNIILNTGTGLIVEDKAKSHISGNLGISASGFSMQMPMDIAGETTITTLQ